MAKPDVTPRDTDSSDTLRAGSRVPSPPQTMFHLVDKLIPLDVQRYVTGEGDDLCELVVKMVTAIQALRAAGVAEQSL